MQAAVAGEQAEGAPALVDVGRRGVFGNRRYRDSRNRSRTCRSTARRAGFPPSIRSWRSSRRPSAPGTAARPPRRSGRNSTASLLADGLFQHLPHQLVIDEGVVVVHFLRIGTIKPLDVGRDTLAKVGLEAIDPHRHQGLLVCQRTTGGLPDW